jgi:formate--tetrahydrofolate ligase
MTVLLQQAMQPNLVQTLENNPAFIHGGPFANIAHGCNSVIATKTALKHADYVITEAGFGADLGAEKFLDIKMRKSGLKPDGAVIVCTLRALKLHGGADQENLKEESTDAVAAGFANVRRHVENTRKFGIPVMVALNSFSADTDAERATFFKMCEAAGISAVESDHWARGGEGAEELAKTVVEMLETQESNFEFLYPDDMPLWDKVKTIATELYHADDIIADQKVRNHFASLQEKYGNLPVCIAKTPLSFTTDPSVKGAPTGHVMPIRELRLSAGAGFIVVVCGDVMTMPGLPRKPAAENIYVREDGEIEGLF